MKRSSVQEHLETDLYNKPTNCSTLTTSPPGTRFVEEETSHVVASKELLNKMKEHYFLTPPSSPLSTRTS
ncbi:hypothetical protein E2C01_040232 [Portunus trituberculatus]|uniref:Uncharacterized protein n=1 Tax=Portunus trituberculatus TaxID=210409 RepID=A0A5B7FJ51_PORTR|nr:hypothetical protein [Portunus trituberculatus]